MEQVILVDMEVWVALDSSHPISGSAAIGTTTFMPYKICYEDALRLDRSIDEAERARRWRERLEWEELDEAQRKLRWQSMNEDARYRLGLGNDGFWGHQLMGRPYPRKLTYAQRHPELARSGNAMNAMMNMYHGYRSPGFTGLTRDGLSSLYGRQGVYSSGAGHYTLTGGLRSRYAPILRQMAGVGRGLVRPPLSVGGVRGPGAIGRPISGPGAGIGGGPGSLRRPLPGGALPPPPLASVGARPGLAGPPPSLARRISMPPAVGRSPLPPLAGGRPPLATAPLGARLPLGTSAGLAGRPPLPGGALGARPMGPGMGRPLGGSAAALGRGLGARPLGATGAGFGARPPPGAGMAGSGLGGRPPLSAGVRPGLGGMGGMGARPGLGGSMGGMGVGARPGVSAGLAGLGASAPRTLPGGGLGGLGGLGASGARPGVGMGARPTLTVGGGMASRPLGAGMASRPLGGVPPGAAPRGILRNPGPGLGAGGLGVPGALRPGGLAPPGAGGAIPGRPRSAIGLSSK
ncbi:hypothetical protein BT69DRAFT_452319 [Atractiella rhizophila]|nr:hypothetical protein BT69DRAFT_452319 [Atractiella rhizophila]